MMRSMTLLSSTAAIAMASDSVASNAQQLWYPEFASNYESGSCTTSPSPALLAFSNGSVNPYVSTMAQNDKQSCCQTWFPDQEGCGCLGACPDEIDDASITSTSTAPTAAHVIAEEHNYWYPSFDVAYEDGKCVKAGVNTDDVPPSYYTEESGFLYSSLDACCERWFEHQETKSCINALDDVVTARPTASMSSVNATTMVPKAVVEPTSGIHVQASIVAEDSL